MSTPVPVPPPSPPPSLVSKHSGFRGILPGCLMVLASLLVIGGFFGIVIGLNWTQFSAGLVAEQQIEAARQAELPSDQLTRIEAAVIDVRDRYVAGQLTREQVNAMGERLYNDPRVIRGITEAWYVKDEAEREGEPPDVAAAFEAVAGFGDRGSGTGISP